MTMYGGDKDGEGSRTKPSSSQDPTCEDPDPNRESEKPSKFGNSGSTASSRELTLSYLCDNPNKLGFPEPPEKVKCKGKETVVSLETAASNREENRWVERDFLSLNGFRGGGGGGGDSSSKRDFDDEVEGSREKKPKLETLNLSLALPDVSLSLVASNPVQNPHPHPQMMAVAVEAPPKPARSIHSLAPSVSNNNTQTTCSNDFTAPSLSYSHSRPFSHNPSCSLTRNSTDFEYCGGEGTNGSVHSRFKPVGDGILFSNYHGGGGSVGHHLMNGGHHRTTANSLHRTASSDNHSFFPSELPARPKFDVQQCGDSRGKGSELMRGFDYGGGARKPSPPERIIRELVSEPIPVTAQMIQEMPKDAIELTKEYLRNLIAAPEKREALSALQSRLDRRSDLTAESLSKAQKDQLEILVAIRTGLPSFLAGNNRLPLPDLLEIFLFMRCRNVNCKSLLPVDDCDCKICSGNKGFCRECMCPVCLSFDCANNTCSWVGCDVCSHWCHAACGIRKNLIKPGPSLKGLCGTTEMQFHCIGCGHASEMFGFVKDVFLCCAKEWGLEALVKELNCVRKIFMGSEDLKGKELQRMTEEVLLKLDRKIMSPSDACTSITQFFSCMYDGISEFPASNLPTSKDIAPSTVRTQVAPPPQPSSLPQNYASFHPSSSSLRSNDLLPHDPHQNGLKAYSSLFSDQANEDEFLLGKKLKKDNGLDSLESIARVKELEARMFQALADDARREAEGYLRIVRASSEKLEEEYAEKLAKLCLKEAEERRRNKFEDLKMTENSRCDYYNMKMRMQAEIAGLLERMEASKQQWA